ncbi:unnamed protein product, partial [Symbiodinium pilosum]
RQRRCKRGDRHSITQTAPVTLRLTKGPAVHTSCLSAVRESWPLPCRRRVRGRKTSEVTARTRRSIPSGRRSWA